MFQDFTDKADEDLPYVLGTLTPEITMIVFGTKGIHNAIKLRKLKDIGELGAGGKAGKIVVIDGKVGGKIPLEEYNALRLSSVKNPGSDTLTLGKYADDASSYTARAGDTTYFDMGSDWNKVMEEYSLNYEDMFEYFNLPVLDEAIEGGKTIQFSHDPRVFETGSLFDEWNYIKTSTGLTDANLVFKGGFWVVQ